MKPIRLTTIGKIIWFFLIVIAVVIVTILISLFKSDEPSKIDKPKEADSEKIIDYTDSKEYTFDFENNTGFKSEKDVITIKESGTYKLVGTNDKYKFVIDSPSSVIKIVFSNFNTSVVYDLLDVKKASKVIIVLEDESENSIVSELLEQEGVKNPTVITSKSDIEIIGSGKLKVATIGDFIVSNGSLSLRNSVLEINNINNGIKLKGNLDVENATLYTVSTEKALVVGGNLTINGGTFVIRSSSLALKSDGIFLINSGKVFIASLKEIQKPNANSLQKSFVFNFKDARNQILFLHDTTQVVLAYAGGLSYQHILYSDDFKSEAYALYGHGKIYGEQVYGLYKPEDSAEDVQLVSEGAEDDKFRLPELVNVYDNIVKK